MGAGGKKEIEMFKNIKSHGKRNDEVAAQYAAEHPAFPTGSVEPVIWEDDGEKGYFVRGTADKTTEVWYYIKVGSPNFEKRK